MLTSDLLLATSMHYCCRPISFDVESSQGVNYVAFLAAFHKEVNTTTDYRIDGHPVLGGAGTVEAPSCLAPRSSPRQGRAARTRSRSQSGRTTLIYVSGFRNRFGEEFAFLGDEGKLPGSKKLSYSGDYPDLFGKQVGYTGLGRIVVSKAEAISWRWRTSEPAAVLTSSSRPPSRSSS